MSSPGGLRELEGRVLEYAAGSYRVDTERAVLDCTLRGRLKRGSSGRVAVGDLVRVEAPEEGSCRIAAVLPRTSALVRRAPHGRRQQTIAANVDRLAAVTSPIHPEPDLHVLDRLLVLAELSSIPPYLVLNKIDLLDPGEPDEVLLPYRRAGYEVVCTSARDGRGLDALRDGVRGRVTVLAGQSGAGKSSLANALVPGLERRVGAVGSRAGRGRHTTVAAALIPLPGGGYLADTPGIQFVGIGAVPPAELADAFPEIRRRAPECRFDDCRHRGEPGCAVLAEVEAGSMSRRRYDSYIALFDEAERERRW